MVQCIIDTVCTTHNLPHTTWKLQTLLADLSCRADGNSGNWWKTQNLGFETEFSNNAQYKEC